MSADEERTAQHEYADEVGLFLESKGMPRIPGRVLGWLLVCEPAHQSAEELVTALSTSRGSVSMAMAMLQRAGAVERFSVPGSRRTFYRMKPGFWLNEAAEKARMAAEWTKLADRGLHLMSEAPQESRQRLRDTRDMYAFLAKEYAQIETRWRQRQKE